MILHKHIGITLNKKRYTVIFECDRVVCGSGKNLQKKETNMMIRWEKEKFRTEDRSICGGFI